MLYGNLDVCTGLEEMMQKILLFQELQPQAGRNACECLNAALVDQVKMVTEWWKEA